MSKFEHLATRYDTRGRKAKFVLPIRGAKDPETGKHLPAALILKHAGETNAGYNNAQNKHNAKTGLGRKALHGRGNDIALERDLDLYPKHVIVGWENIPDTDWKAIPYTPEDCADFVQNGLQTWIFNEVRMFAIQAENFLADDEPTSDEIDETAGN